MSCLLTAKKYSKIIFYIPTFDIEPFLLSFSNKRTPDFSAFLFCIPVRRYPVKMLSPGVFVLPQPCKPFACRSMSSITMS